MGIPSFYRRLSVVHKGLITKDRGTKAAALYFDFNCLIYHVARSKKMPAYSVITHKEWEAKLLENIQQYIVHVWRQGGEPSEVFLAVDGVVPLAKIKQQRLRRFKSAWLVEEERQLGIRETHGESWDTNSITPGTLFMEKLGTSLRSLCKQRGKGWSVSDAEEPGEGEQKIMRLLRQRNPQDYNGSVLVYGLDADLILLTMLNGVGRGLQNCFLMREDEEFGRKNPAELEAFSYFNMNKLPPSLWKDFNSLTDEQKSARIRNYVAGMSLLGNDFLPHSLSMKVREDGHEQLAKDLLELEAKGLSFLVQDSSGQYVIQKDVLLSLVSKWATDEDATILDSIRKKLVMRHTVNQVDAEQVLQNRPLEWSVEAEAVQWEKGEGGKSRLSFRGGWRSVYHEKWNKQTPMETLCQQYLYGLQWIIHYYTGQQEVPNTWMYPTSLPPFWSDLAQFLKSGQSWTGLAYQKIPIQPQQQLAMVLPLSSWYLIRDKSLRGLPQTQCQYWPSKFGFFSVGKRFLWECEPEIPHLPLSVINREMR